MKRFFHPTKGGRIAAQKRAEEKHQAEMEAFRRREELFKRFTEVIQPIAGSLTRNFLRSMGIDPFTGQYTMNAMTMATLGRTGAANREAMMQAASMLAQQGVDPQQIAKMQANMINQNLLQMAQQAEAQKQQAFQNAVGMGTGLAGVGFQLTPAQTPVSQGTDWGATIANIAGNYMIWREMEKYNKRVNQQQQTQQTPQQPRTNNPPQVATSPQRFERMTPYGGWL